MSLNAGCLHRTYGPSHYEVTEAVVDDYLRATLDEPDDYHQGALRIPPTLAFLPCWPVILQALEDPDLGNAGQIIHGEQVMHIRRPLAIGDVLTTTGTVTTIAPKGRNELYVLTLRTVDERGAIVNEQENICISLGTGSQASRQPEDKPRQSPPAQDTPRDEARTFRRDVDLPADITTRYAEASGDHNQVHLDDQFARGLGFPGRIVHGMCLVSIALQGVVHDVTNGRPNRITGLRVRFAGPARPGDTLSTKYSVRPGLVDFESATTDGRKVLTAGTATLLSKEETDE